MQHPIPVDVLGVTTARTIAAASGHTCASLDDGSARCWGFGWSGALGDGRDLGGPFTAVTPSGLSGVVRVATGWSSTCALDGSGAVHCWGANTYGQLGVGDRVARLAPTRVAGLPLP